MYRLFCVGSRLRARGSSGSKIFSGGVETISGRRFVVLQQLKEMENSEQFVPQNLSEQSEERCGRPKKQQKYVRGPNNGIWTDLQHAKYIVFMEHHKDKMRSREKRRSSKLYKAMAEYIGSRNALQCRSHHQKLEEKYLYPNKIIAHHKQHHDLTLYLQLKQELEEREPRSASSPADNLKLQDQESAGLSQQGPSQPPENNRTNESTDPTTPKSHDSPPLSYGFRPIPSEGWISAPAVNWTPYYFYPVLSFF